MEVKIHKNAYEQICASRGYTKEETSEAILREEGDAIFADDEHPKFPHSRGVGAELKKLLKLVGITSSPNCSCNKRAEIMDNEGILWCKSNKSIILDWLQEESNKRKLPFIRFGAEQIVNMAIRRAEKKGYKQ